MLTKSKLTLWLDNDSKSFGKSWAKRHKQSLSFLLSSYLRRLKDAEEGGKATPIVSRLSGKIKTASVKDYRKYLEKKYLNA